LLWILFRFNLLSSFVGWCANCNSLRGLSNMAFTEVYCLSKMKIKDKPCETYVHQWTLYA